MSYVDTVCRLVAEAAPEAMVVASPPSWEPGGHVTVVHHVGEGLAIDAAVVTAGLRIERIDATRVMVFAP